MDFDVVQLRALFDELIQIPVSQRSAVLEARCKGNDELRRRLEELIATAEDNTPFLSAPTADVSIYLMPLTAEPTTKSAPLAAHAGTVIGPYKLLQQIGQGGFGAVYVAEQKTPIKRRVALKIIKLGMDTRAVVARFEAERQALAMMDHPNIAKVFDAGVTDTGRPYFVMELVRGIPITDYCDQNNLPPSQRLKLFIDICHAIQHAHQKGVIHRDIKPSNILVTLHDGVPVPKVIDFGIAKATQGELTDKTIYTQFEQFIGTPAYMSPEQAEMSGLDIDTRSDIYSLGVLLYELLIGTPPFDAKELAQAGLDEMRRKIRETDPARPSNRLRTMPDEASTTTAKRRGMEPRQLISLLRGDLDWIVMKCLEKDRTRRYESASGLAVDIQGHLNDETVSARPPSNWYRLRKSIRRNKAAYLAGSAITGALVLGIIATSWQAVRATRATLQAQAAQAKAEAAEKEQAKLRAKAEQEAAWSKQIAQANAAELYGHYDQAEKLLNAIPLQDSMSETLLVLVNSRVASRQWREAYADFAKLYQLRVEIPGKVMVLALFSFASGDMQAYERWRAEILRSVDELKRQNVSLSYASLVSLLAQPSATQVAAIQSLLSSDGVRPEYGIEYPHSLAEALLEYRLGHFARAKQAVQPMMGEKGTSMSSASFWDFHVGATMLLAMAEHQSGETEEAETAFRAGLELADQKLVRAEIREDCDDWLIANFLMREAAKLMPNVIASNNVFAGIIAEKPGWQIALDKSHWKYTCNQMTDGTYYVVLENQPISDLSPLHGAPISKLRMNGSAIADLSPLAGMPLKMLEIAGAKVTDLTPLSGMRLTDLNIAGTSVSDLSPLRGMPLIFLHLSGCRNIADLSPLEQMTTLEMLELPPHARNIEFLRAFPNMKRIGYKYDPKLKAPDMTAAEFWKAYDKTRNRKDASTRPRSS